MMREIAVVMFSLKDLVFYFSSFDLQYRIVVVAWYDNVCVYSFLPAYLIVEHPLLKRSFKKIKDLS